MGPGGRMPGRGLGSALPAGPIDPRCVMAGVTFLGKDESAALKQKAAEEGTDVLALFEVKIDVNIRNNVVTNESRIILWDVWKGQEICRTKLINAVKIQQHHGDPRYADEDLVGDAIDKIFADIDGKSEAGAAKQLKMTEFPKEILPVHAAGRVAMLLASQPTHPLPALAEVKYYHERGLIDDAAFTAACQTLVGDTDGKTLAEGKDKQRRAIVEKLVPEFIEPNKKKKRS